MREWQQGLPCHAKCKSQRQSVNFQDSFSLHFGQKNAAVHICKGFHINHCRCVASSVVLNLVSHVCQISAVVHTCTKTKSRMSSTGLRQMRLSRHLKIDLRYFEKIRGRCSFGRPRALERSHIIRRSRAHVYLPLPMNVRASTSCASPSAVTSCIRTAFPSIRSASRISTPVPQTPYSSLARNPHRVTCRSAEPERPTSLPLVGEDAGVFDPQTQTTAAWTQFTVLLVGALGGLYVVSLPHPASAACMHLQPFSHLQCPLHRHGQRQLWGHPYNHRSCKSV